MASKSKAAVERTPPATSSRRRKKLEPPARWIGPQSIPFRIASANPRKRTRGAEAQPLFNGLTTPFRALGLLRRAKNIIRAVAEPRRFVLSRPRPAVA